jgi:hypothetical protein
MPKKAKKDAGKGINTLTIEKELEDRRRLQEEGSSILIKNNVYATNN